MRKNLPDSLSGKVFSKAAAGRQGRALDLHSNRSAKLLSPTPKLCALGNLLSCSVPQFALIKMGVLARTSELLGDGSQNPNRKRAHTESVLNAGGTAAGAGKGLTLGAF